MCSHLRVCDRVLREDAVVVEGDECERIGADICASGPAGDGDNLLGMEMDCRVFLGDPAFASDDPGLWHDMTVRRSAGAEWLIIGRGVGRFGDGPAVRRPRRCVRRVPTWNKETRS
jgi:hypothetical protein